MLQCVRESCPWPSHTGPEKNPSQTNVITDKWGRTENLAKNLKSIFLIPPVQRAEPITSELINTILLTNWAHQPEYRVLVHIPLNKKANKCISQNVDLFL